MLEFANGRRVTIVQFDQRHVYADLLEGVPTPRFNRRIVDDLVAEASRARVHPPYLVTPVERPLGPGRLFMGERPARLPPFACVSRLHSGALDPERANAGCYASALTLIWFQDELAMPIDPAVVAHVGTLDWSSLASEWEL